MDIQEILGERQAIRICIHSKALFHQWLHSHPADELWSLLHNWLHIKKPASPQTAALRSRVGQRVEWISIVYSSRFVHVIYVRRLQKKSDRAMKNCA